MTFSSLNEFRQSITEDDIYEDRKKYPDIWISLVQIVWNC